jgi:hypothetical protein
MTRITLLLALLASVAHAEPNDEAALGSWVRALHAPSANAVTEQPLGGGTFAYAREVIPQLVVPGLSLWGVGTIAFGGATGTMFQTMTTSLDYAEFTVGARARYRLWRFLEAGARIDAGTTRVALAIDADAQSYRDHGWGAISSSALSLDILPYAGRSFAFGFRGELGYATASGVALTPRMDRPDDGTIELPMTRASLGHLDLGGKYLTFTLFAHF